MRVWFGVLLCAAGAACSPLPELNAPIPANVQNAEYPVLLPLGDLAAPTDELDTVATQDELTARVAALQARAEALRNRPIE